MASLFPFRATDLVVAGLVAAATAVVALGVFVADPRRSSNQWLAFFLVLIAGNYAAQAWEAVYDIRVVTGALPPDVGAAGKDFARHVGFVFLAFDPAALLYFAFLFPRRTGLAERRWGVWVLAALSAAFLAVEVADRRLSSPASASDPVRVAFFVWMAVCYVVASWRLVANLLGEPSRVMADQVRTVAFGVVVAALPRAALLPADLFGAYDRPLAAAGAPPWVSILVDVALRVALLAALWLALGRSVRRAPTGDRRVDALRVVRNAGAVFAVFAFLWLFERGTRAAVVGGAVVPGGLVDAMEAVSRSVPFAIRWLAFSAAIGYGVVRYQVLAVDADVLAGAGGSLAAAVGALVVAAGASALGPWAAGGAAALLVAGAFAAAWFGLRKRHERRRSRDYAHERALEVYRAMLAAAVAEGPLGEAREAGLSRARQRLGVSRSEHDVLLAVAQMEESGEGRDVVLGRYVVLRRLGAGGHATVHLAKDKAADRLVVLKRIRADWAGSDGALDSALREFEVARRVSHPHVVAVEEIARTADGALVVMEFVEGGSLEDLLKREGAMSSERVARLLDEALAGLAALHDAGIVHGDLKPGNVLLTGEAAVKISDFGTARTADAARTLVRGTSRAAPGTVLYMSPEQARGGRPTPQSDLYALGAVAFEALTGRPLAGGGGPYDVLRRIAAPGAGDRPAFPRGWETFLGRALAADPTQRYRDAAEMRRALAAVAAGARREANLG